MQASNRKVQQMVQHMVKHMEQSNDTARDRELFFSNFPYVSPTRQFTIFCSANTKCICLIILNYV
jgi:hypothetical protein